MVLSNKQLAEYYASTLTGSRVVRTRKQAKLLHYLEKNNDKSLEAKIKMLSKVCDYIEHSKTNHEDTFLNRTVYLSDESGLAPKAMRTYGTDPVEVRIPTLKLGMLQAIENNLSEDLKPIFQQLYSNSNLDEIILDDSFVQRIDEVESKLKDIKDKFYTYGELLLPDTEYRSIDFGPLKIKYLVKPRSNGRISKEKEEQIIQSYLNHKKIRNVEDELDVSFATVKATISRNNILNYEDEKNKIKLKLIDEGLNSREIADKTGLTTYEIRTTAHRENKSLSPAPSSVKKIYTKEDYELIDAAIDKYTYASKASANAPYSERVIAARIHERGLYGFNMSESDLRTLYHEFKGKIGPMAKKANVGIVTMKTKIETLDDLPEFKLPKVSWEQEGEYKQLHKTYEGKIDYAVKNSSHTLQTLKRVWGILELEIIQKPRKNEELWAKVKAYKIEHPNESQRKIAAACGCTKNMIPYILGLVKPQSKNPNK